MIVITVESAVRCVDVPPVSRAVCVRDGGVRATMCRSVSFGFVRHSTPHAWQSGARWGARSSPAARTQTHNTHTHGYETRVATACQIASGVLKRAHHTSLVVLLKVKVLKMNRPQ